jgi:hypothetical protein
MEAKLLEVERKIAAVEFLSHSWRRQKSMDSSL